MMKNYNITCYADLEREEKRVKSRIRKQEEEILTRVKQLPEEILIAGITKAINSVLNGSIVKSGMSIFRSIASHFFKNKKAADEEIHEESDENPEEKNNSLKDTIIDLLKGYVNKKFSAE